MILGHMDFMVCEATKWSINYEGLGMRLFLLQIGGGKAFVSRFLVSGSLQHEGRKLPPATARQVKPERTTKPCRPGSKGAGSAQYSGMCVGRGQEFYKVMGIPLMGQW